MELHLEKENLHTFLNNLSASSESLAHHQQIHFEKRSSFHQQIFGSTLIRWKDHHEPARNAFKFTPASGTILFTARLQKQNDKDRLVLIVSDTGKGISPQEQELVFSSFYRAHDEATEGTGFRASH